MFKKLFKRKKKEEKQQKCWFNDSGHYANGMAGGNPERAAQSDGNHAEYAFIKSVVPRFSSLHK